ncbi:glycerate kinase family protein [Actinospongicola halichondriae]|uniref:glycerate kinase family protein n=1 Tax=Actinospongicola halichondriae TaxID=3236844 RepID=UPI003D4B9D81
MRVVAAPDKFRGTASAAAVAAAIARAAVSVGWSCDQVPVADGGEGTIDALGGPNRTTVVRGPLGEPVEAAWRLDRDTAIIEMASASGLLLAGGAENNDPIAADTHGTGELIRLAVESGARRVIVGLGGSATTDGGLGALRAMHPLQRYRAVELRVACDVRTTFVDAARTFGPQKGATAAQVRLLENRLVRLADVYEQDHGVDVRSLARSGAAGGLAGGLAAIGAQLEDGFALVSDEVALDEVIAGADLVVTGEGFLDDESFDGKVVGGVVELADSLGVPVVAIVGQVIEGAGHGRSSGPEPLEVVSLVDRFGEDASMHDTVTCVESAVRAVLEERSAIGS